MKPEPEWIEEKVVRLFHQRQLAEHGGPEGTRDEGLLLSALSRPQQLWHYGNPEPDLCARATAYAHGIAKNHPFFDGNKRSTAIACELFLKLNGLYFIVGEEIKYPNYLALAAGEHDEESFAQWLRGVTSDAN
jgi:death-on-curing protein